MRKVSYFITIIVTITITVVAKNFTTVDQLLNDVQNYWNNSLAFGNTIGIVSPVVALAAIKYAIESKNKEQTVKINISDATDKMDHVVDNQNQLNGSVQAIADMVMTAFVDTKIPTETKTRLLELYKSVQTNVIETTRGTKKAVETFTEIIDQAKEQATEIVKESTSIFDELTKRNQV